MTPAISINTLCLDPGSLAEHAEAVAKLGASMIAPVRDEVETLGGAGAAKLLSDTGLRVALMTHMAFGFGSPEIGAEERERLNHSIDLAHDIGAPALCMTTGGRGSLSWKDAAKRFASQIAASAEYARSAGVMLGIEPTSHLFADISLGHRLSDISALARAAGINLGIDIFACWTDSNIDEAIAEAGPLTAFVQVSDYVPGDRGLPCRAVPGDGAIPLDRIVGQILATGFRGPFDLEIIGPRLIAEGREAGLRRGMARLTEAIERGMAR